MMTSSVARIEFIKIKVIFSYHNKNHKVKKYSCSNSSIKMRKTKKWKKNYGLQNLAIRGLQIEAKWITNRSSFMDFKSGQKYYISRQRNLKSGQRLQIGPKEISNGNRDYKSV